MRRRSGGAAHAPPAGPLLRPSPPDLVEGVHVVDSALRLGGAGARLQEDLPARHHLVRLVQAGGPYVLHPRGHHGPRPWDSCVGVRGWELKGWRWTGMAGWAGWIGDVCGRMMWCSSLCETRCTSQDFVQPRLQLEGRLVRT